MSASDGSEPNLLTYAQVKRLLNASDELANELSDAGALGPVIKLGATRRRWRYHEHEVLGFIDRGGLADGG